MRTRSRHVISVLAAAAVLLGVASGTAAASGGGVGWQVSARSYPTNFKPGGTGRIAINVLTSGLPTAAAPLLSPTRFQKA